MALQYPREMLAQLIAEGRLPVNPDQHVDLLALVDTVFFASLMVEEGAPVRIAVVHDDDGADGLAKMLATNADPEAGPVFAWDVTAITRRALEAHTLAKLSRGLKYGAQVVVVGGMGSMWIDGIARRRHTDGGTAVRIAAPRPGVLTFERGSSQFLKFDAGEQAIPSIDVLGTDGPALSAIRAICAEGPNPSGFYEQALRRLVDAMRATESGALFALLPTEPPATSLDGVKYARLDTRLFSERIRAHKDLWWKSFGMLLATHGRTVRHEVIEARDRADADAEFASERLNDAIEDLARLSAIDGAVLAGPGLQIYGAGYIINDEAPPVGMVFRSLDAAGIQTEPYPARHGARHAAGFAFAWSNPGGVAFIVSEDGPVKCAMRVEDRVLVWDVEVLET